MSLSKSTIQTYRSLTADNIPLSSQGHEYSHPLANTTLTPTRPFPHSVSHSHNQSHPSRGSVFLLSVFQANNLQRHNTLGVTRLVVHTFTTHSPSHVVTILINTLSLSMFHTLTVLVTHNFLHIHILLKHSTVQTFRGGLCELVRSADGAPRARTATRPLTPCPGLPELLCPGKEHPPLPGHSPGWLSALFLALWKGLFFFLSPWKGKHSTATLRLTLFQTLSLTRTDGAPLSCRERTPLLALP